MSENQEKHRSRILLVDDHPMVREHLAALILREPDLEVAGEAGDAPTALALVGRHAPDLVILDISLAKSHGLELLKDLKCLQPDLLVLVLSMHDETLYAERALRAGAMGYITKEEATVSILLAIRKVLSGQVYVSERLSAQMMSKLVRRGNVEASSPADLLTDRELEVFQLIGQGVGTRKIAEELRLGIKTVESYRARIKEKLNLTDGNRLLQYAIQWAQKRNEP